VNIPNISIQIQSASGFGNLNVRDQVRGRKGPFERLGHSRFTRHDSRQSHGHLALELAYRRVLDFRSRALRSGLDIRQNGIRIRASVEDRGSWGLGLVGILSVEHAIILAQAVVVLIVLDLHVVHHVESVLLIIGAPGHGEGGRGGEWIWRFTNVLITIEE